MSDAPAFDASREPPLSKPKVEWSPAALNSATFQPMPTLLVPCYHCGQATRVVGYTVIDAERDMWREKYERLRGELNEAVRRSHLVHGDDPMRQDFVAALLRIRDRL